MKVLLVLIHSFEERLAYPTVLLVMNHSLS